jgi:dienelactone hydrolase
MLPPRSFLAIVAAGCLFALATSPATAAAPADERRRADLQLLLDRLIPSRPPLTGRITAQDKSWEDWVRRTGELPPDFSRLPSIPHLPDPLVVRAQPGGVRITSAAQWQEQRQWIREQIEQWVFGRMPPAPDNLRVAATREEREGNVTIRHVLLEFGPGHQAKLNLELMIPDGPGPFPVFLTNHSRRRSTWVHTAVSRGYIACYYRATDPRYGEPDDSDAYIDIYPEYDFSCLARWAWAAARAVDYLHTRPEVARDQIGITGHSRNGKQALLAAAFDERIGAVVASSGLTGEALPWRYTADPFVVESIQLLTGAQPHWFHPRLRFFAGREDRLPVDQNLLMALIAPRGLMVYTAHTEASANAFALEQIYRSARQVYRFLDREKNVWLHLRDGEHATQTADIEHFMDFFDSVFGRRSFPKSETFIHGYDFETWRTTTRQAVDPRQFPARAPGELWRQAGRLQRDQWDEGRRRIRSAILWTLGVAPPSLPPPSERALRENQASPRNADELIFNRPQADAAWQSRLAAAGMGLSSLTFGAGHRADVFYPIDETRKMKRGPHPVVVWLHPYAYAVGWSAKLPWNPNQADFLLDQRPSFDSLVRRGFVVVAFDQIGFGGRAHEARRFYERHPEWSLLGKMVTDTQAVVSAIAGLEQVDPRRIYLMGYALGAKVGLLTTAMDDTVRGVVAVSGLFPMRLHTPAKGTEGLEHYAHLHGLLPRLGFFVAQEQRVPFDYDEVLALAAPKRVLIVAPELDRFAPVDDVRTHVAAAREVYQSHGQAGALQLWTPRDFNRFPRQLQEDVFTYLQQAAADDVR